MAKTPRKAAARSKAAPKKASTTKSKKRAEEYSRYCLYVYEVLKQGMSIVNSVICDIYQRIVGKLYTINDKATMSSYEIQAAVRMMIPRETNHDGSEDETKLSSPP